MKNSFFILILSLIAIQGVVAQRIRTDHREMTPGQKTAYLLALNAIHNNGVNSVIVNMANHHNTHFDTEIHTRQNPINGTQFLPWHRVFQLDFEEVLRTAGTTNSQFITIPYWDWRVENTVAGVSWDDANFLSTANLTWTISRPFSSTPLGSNTDVNDLLAMPGSILPTTHQFASATSNFFSKRLEHWHNQGHGFVNGTMGGRTSPLDPVFYLHHGFIDKLWQEWEDRDNAVQSVFNYSSLIDSYSPINPNTIIDSRKTRYPITSTNILEVDVWYAFNKKLLLDGLAGDFNVTGTGKVYSYTPYNTATSVVEGVIYAGDVRRDASDNVIADNKGGFVVKNGADCSFKSGKEIRLLSGFRAEAGSSFVAQIVTAPHGHSSTSGRIAAATVSPSVEELNKRDLRNDIKFYPNPIQSELNVEFSLADESMVSMVIYNNLGQIVYRRMDSSPLAPGAYLERIDFDGYSKGVYLLNFKVNNSTKTFKLMK